MDLLMVMGGSRAAPVSRDRMAKVTFWLAIILLCVWSQLALAADDYCVNDSAGYNCYPTLPEAELQMRSRSVYGSLLKKSETGYFSQDKLKLVYTVANRPPELYFPAVYFIGGSHPMTQQMCTPNNIDPYYPTLCLDENEGVSNFIAWSEANAVTCQYSGWRMTGYYAEPYASVVDRYGTRNGSLYTQGNNQTGDQIRQLKWEIICPGWSAPETGSLWLQKYQTFTCPVGFVSRNGYSPANNTTGNPYFDVLPSQLCRPESSSFPYIVVPKKQYGSCPTTDGNPCVAATGNKEYRESLMTWEGLSVSLAYNSLRDLPLKSGLGDSWAHFLSDRISLDSTSPVAWIRGDGYFEMFDDKGAGVYKSQFSSALMYKQSQSTAEKPWFFKVVIGDVSREFDQDGRLSRLIKDSKSFDFDYCTDVEFDQGGCEEAGLLKLVTASSGRTLSFHYEQYSFSVGSAWRISDIDFDGIHTVELDYDSDGRLIRSAVAIGASSNGRQYIYAEAANLCRDASGSAVSGCNPNDFPQLLTGVLDESAIRFATYQYDEAGRVVDSSHAGGAGRVKLNYGTPGFVSVNMPGGAIKRYAFYGGSPVRAPTDMTLQRSDGTVISHSSYTYSGLTLTSQISATGFKSTYDWDGFNRIRVVEGLTQAGASTVQSRTIETDWDRQFNLPTEKRWLDSSAQLKGKSSWTYNTRGQALSATQTDSATGATRVATTTYCESADITNGTCPLLGLITAVNGPRNDVTDTTTYTYYPADDATCASSPQACPHRKGDLWKVTDALGRVTETLAYDGAGRPLSVKDANGVITDMEYHPRSWLTARKVRGTNNAVETDDQITQIEYWPTGLVKKVTQPDGAFTAYTYDAAHRLTDISDNAGNTIHYTLDNAGNRTAEATKDSGGNLKRTLSRIYNQLGQLQTAKDAYNHATGFTYDANGNNQLVTDALSRVTDNDYDPLNRLARTLQDAGGIAAETKFEYDALDNLTKITDPKGLDTTYQYNGLGDLTQLASPDTGTTTYTYDGAGNRKTQTDARGIVSTYSYDALNRLTGIAYPTSSLNVGYLYDTANPVCTAGETFAIGRLTQMTDSSGDTQYCYDRFGNLTRKVQTTNAQVFTLRYAYTLAGQLQAITYPDGAIVDYVRDGQGRITEVGATPAGGVRAILLNQATYHPFGPVASWVYGNGRTMARPLNQNYQPTAVVDSATGGLSLGYEFDAVGNLSKLYNADQSITKAQYVYDALNRLADVKDGPTGTVIEHYGYDATGNRTSFTNAGGTTSYTYPTTNHRLTQVGATARTYDNVGNTTQIGGTAKEFIYNDSGRMSQVKTSGTATMNYLLNGRGEQVRKFLNTNNTYTVYDEAGQWIGDYDNSGNALQQAIWLGDLPVGLLASNQLKYLQPDHLGTPRTVIDSVTDVTIWSWELKGEAFGSTAPNQDPDNNGTSLVFNMRFPGQRYDVASDLNYNYFRDYEPRSGRYMESDPLGQRAGVNTFAYAAGSPLNAYDPYGLKVIWKGTVVSGALIDGVGAGVFVFDLKSDCVNGKQVSAVVIAPAVAAGFGAKATGGGSSVQLHDWTNDPNADTLNGVFVAISAGIVVGGGGGWSKYTVGNAYSDGLGWMPQGPAYGFDFSVGAFVGSAAVVSSSTATCDENCQGSSR